MDMDRSLTTLLRALQSASDPEEVSRLLSLASTLLTLLSNPWNITLLTSQLLSAPSIWQRPDGLRTTLHVFGIFSSTATHINRQAGASGTSRSTSTRNSLNKEEWVIAVVKGADNRSPRWRHLCVLAGLLAGFEGIDQRSLSASIRRLLESAIVKAINFALSEGEGSGELAYSSIAVILSRVFDLLPNSERLNLDHNLLLPILYRPPFFSKEGLHSGYFLSTIDADIMQDTGSRFDWSPKSTTYVQLQRMATGPLISSLGSLSRMIAFSVENVSNIDLSITMIGDIGALARSILIQWRQNKLSEIDVTEETTFLTEETLETTLPLLWHVLKANMFAIVIIFKALLGCSIGDAHIHLDNLPYIAIQTLHVLRNIYFITSRLGANAFSQYTFVYLTAIDILAQYPVQAEAFLREIRPKSAERISQHPLDRCHDLYFLNTAEHFSTVLSPALNEELLIPAANIYLGLGSDPRLNEIFEAAHCVMLAVLSAPQNSEIVSRGLHAYVEVLFKVFPENLSVRQFRLALQTLIRVVSPPSLISDTQPLLPSTLLELVRFRLETASSKVKAPLQRFTPTDEANPMLSEQSALMLTLIDALPFLPVDQLEDWLPIVADSMDYVRDDSQLRICKERFWEVLSRGEMDVDRAALCIAWWNSRGKDVVLGGMRKQEAGPFMSGGLQEMSKL